MTKRCVLSSDEIQRRVESLSAAVMERVSDAPARWVFVGIQRRGVPLARRLVQSLAARGCPPLPVGRLDIAFYRDDAAAPSAHPVVHETDMPFDITGRTLFLVDDVLFTGRTIRCALDELMDFGRPARVYLVVLVDRGHRELPIQADFIGETIATLPQERVDVRLTEIDGEDGVFVGPAGEAS